MVSFPFFATKEVKRFVTLIPGFHEILIDPFLLPEKNYYDAYLVELRGNGYFIPSRMQEQFGNIEESRYDSRILSFMLSYLGDVIPVNY